MSIRPEIQHLVHIGSLPAKQEPSIEQLRQVGDLLLSVTKPVSDDETKALACIFGPDGCFGLASTLLHLIETAPGRPLVDCLIDSGNELIASLKERTVLGGVL